MLFQTNKGYGDALINGIENTKTDIFVFLMRMVLLILKKFQSCLIKLKAMILILFLAPDI